MKQVALILTVAFGLNRTAISRVLSFILKYIMLFEKKNKSKGSIETQGKTWIQTWTLLLAYRLSLEHWLKLFFLGFTFQKNFLNLKLG